MFATIAWASDGSPAADRALGWVAQLAATERAMLWILHIAAPGGTPATARGEAEEATIAKLKGQVRELRDHGFDASLYVIRGADVAVGVAIGAGARAVGADLLVVGTGGPPRPGAPAAGGVAVKVLADAACPVLALPALVTRRAGPAAARR